MFVDILLGYLYFCLAAGLIMFMYFVFSDLKRLYMNRNRGTQYLYYFVDHRWQIAVFTLLFMIPVVNIGTILVFLGMAFKPFNFIIRFLKTH